MNVATIIAKTLKSHGIKNIFMLTGYGSMYLNDAIEREKIKFYAARNEASAPMMAQAYARQKRGVGAVCVTAGPGATNALPGLAEAYVDSAPIIIISGQVEKKYCADNYKNKIRSLGTAEFSIKKTVETMTKYATTIKNPYDCKFEIDKAINIALSGRPGPVWVEIPLDVQNYNIKNINKLKKFKLKKINNKKITLNSKIDFILKKIEKSKKPLILIGNGIKQSNSQKKILSIIKKLQIPCITSRFANDLIPPDSIFNMGLCGIKGSPGVETMVDQCDFILALGCRFAPTLCFGDPKKFAEKAYIVSVNNDLNELNLNLKKINFKLNVDIKFFLEKFEKKIKNNFHKSSKKWINNCLNIKKENQIKNIFTKKNPIDLYRFMYLMTKYSKKNNIFVTDAGSNYYIGGQVWQFKEGQQEISSVTNAAMGLSVPLSIGAAISNKKKQILSVTGDGSIELNIQELKTISHYKLNIKTFVINNGGYVSMKKWQDNFFKGNRLDTEINTGVGTLVFKDIAKAFGLKYLCIKKENQIKKILKKSMSNKYPYLIEVITDPNQKIYGKEF